MNKLNYLLLSSVLMLCNSIHGMKRSRIDYETEQAKTLLARARSLAVFYDHYITKAGYMKCYSCFNAESGEPTELFAVRVTNTHDEILYHAGDKNNNDVYFTNEEARVLFYQLESRYPHRIMPLQINPRLKK